MDIFEAINKRRAVHDFIKGPALTDDQLEELFGYASLTPSGYNVQPWRFVVIREEDRKKELVDIAFGQEHVVDAAANIVVLGNVGFADEGEAVAKLWEDAGYMDGEEAAALAQAVGKKRDEQKTREMVIRNVGLVSMTLMLAAEGMGLATCPMMGFSKWKMRKFLDLPDTLLPGMLIAVGHQDQTKVMLPRLPRKSFEELVRFETWG